MDTVSIEFPRKINVEKIACTYLVSIFPSMNKNVKREKHQRKKNKLKRKKVSRKKKRERKKVENVYIIKLQYVAETSNDF